MHLDVHTNIPLDYPTAKNGFIYTTENITAILVNPEFQERIESGQLFGTFGKTELQIDPADASHVVRKAYVSEDGEIRFFVETLDNELGNKLVSASKAGAIIAKMVARIDKTVVNGKLKLHDIRYVHIVGGTS